MELTRRDAAAALAALGVGSLGAGCFRTENADESIDTERIREALLAAAEVVYPDEVTGIETFLETFLDSRLEDATHTARLAETVAKLDDLAEQWHDDRFVDLSKVSRDQFLREVGADSARENPTGTTAERVRYYVVNELLLALYSSPTGGELVGIENPQGHPGGIESYRRGPEL